MSRSHALQSQSRKSVRCRSKLGSGQQQQPSSDTEVSSIENARVPRLELMFRIALFCKPPLFTALFANGPVNECSEAISNLISTEQMITRSIHFAAPMNIRIELPIWMCRLWQPHHVDESGRSPLAGRSSLFPPARNDKRVSRVIFRPRLFPKLSWCT